jgi:hypothetical protein
MTLPAITTPTYELILPSNEKKIKYRPFLVREEKILILALQSQDNAQITNAVKQVLKSCLVTRGVNVDKLPTFDIEYLFLNIRAKSIGESIKIVITCADDGETEVPVTIFVDEIQVKKNKDHKNDIVLDDKTLRMKYPSLEEFVESNFEVDDKLTPEEKVDLTLKPVANCLEMLFNEEDAWDFSSYSEKEKINFLGKLTSKQYKEVERFFATMPKLSHEFIVENPKTGIKNPVVLEGLKDFFA